MTDTEKNTKQIKAKKGSIKEAVINWSNSDGENYPEKSKLEDLQSNGCVSGMVNDLIYYVDTVKFFKAHKKEIMKITVDYMHQAGMSFTEFIQGANNFPLKEYELNSREFNTAIFTGGLTGLIETFKDDSDQIMNWFSWFGFEETANQYYSEKYEN